MYNLFPTASRCNYFLRRRNLSYSCSWKKCTIMHPTFTWRLICYLFFFLNLGFVFLLIAAAWSEDSHEFHKLGFDLADYLREKFDKLFRPCLRCSRQFGVHWGTLIAQISKYLILLHICSSVSHSIPAIFQLR
jgi:hypothetical protein